MEAVRTSETSVDNYFTRQYIPEDNSEHHTRRRENLKSHIFICSLFNDAFSITQIIQHRMKRMKSEYQFKRMWKEAIVA
jgi:hypothetical protein